MVIIVRNYSGSEDKRIEIDDSEIRRICTAFAESFSSELCEKFGDILSDIICGPDAPDSYNPTEALHRIADKM